MKIREQNASLECVCGQIKQFPMPSLPEVAFIGKSNVGKSSLINMLLNRKGLARTSATPGKTRTINWYRIDDQIFFVDLPGYGYAKTSKTEQASWAKTIETYLGKREPLRGVLLLVDIRHDPGSNDCMMMDWLRHFGIPTIIIATKADKITRNQTASRIKHIAETLRIRKDQIVPVSALLKSGRDEAWKKILSLVTGEEAEEEEPDGSSAV